MRKLNENNRIKIFEEKNLSSKISIIEALLIKSEFIYYESS